MDMEQQAQIVREVKRVLECDPLLARRLRPQARPGGQWVVVLDDRARERLCRHLEQLDGDGWQWLEFVPMLFDEGRCEVPVLAPGQGVEDP